MYIICCAIILRNSERMGTLLFNHAYIRKEDLFMDGRKFFTGRASVPVIAIIATLLWGSAYPAVKSGYEIFKILQKDIPTKLIFAGYRFAIAGLLVLFVSWAMNRKLKLSGAEEVSKVFILGVFYTTIQYIFFYVGLANTTGVNGSIMNGTVAFFSVVFAHFFYKNDKLNVTTVMGCIIGFLGIIIINFSENLAISFNLYGDGFIIISAIFLSAASIYGKELSKSINSILLTGYQLLFGGTLLIILGFVTGGQPLQFTFNGAVLLTYMSLLSAAAFTLWTLLLKYNKVGRITVYNFLIPIFGAVLSAIILGENIFHWKNLIALTLVSTGIFIVNRKS